MRRLRIKVETHIVEAREGSIGHNGDAHSVRTPGTRREEFE